MTRTAQAPKRQTRNTKEKTVSRIVYVNGDYLPEEDAKISIFDRSFLMADGVYEVTSVLDGKLIDFDGHIARLERSLNELDMDKPGDKAKVKAIVKQWMKTNVLKAAEMYDKRQGRDVQCVVVGEMIRWDEV